MGGNDWDFHDMTWKQIILQHLAPGLGCLVALAMYISPLQAVVRQKKQAHLGDLNPLPLVAIIANCSIWLLYGCLLEDWYVVLANEPGLLVGIFMTVSAYGVADAKARDLMLKLLLFFVTLISVGGVAIALILDDDDEQVSAAGWMAIFIQLCFYTSPLTTLWEVLRTRSSASLYAPSSIMQTVNGSLWTAYGLATENVVIWGPNLAGTVMGLIQLLLIAIFPVRSHALTAEEGTVRSLLRPHDSDDEAGTEV